VLITLAQANQVRVFCVAFGPDINTNALQRLTSQTLGRYYEAATTADLPAQFLKIVKDIDGAIHPPLGHVEARPEILPAFVPNNRGRLHGLLQHERFLYDQHHG